MRKNLLIGSILAAILILIVPSASAVDFSAVHSTSTVQSIQETRLQDLLKNPRDSPQPNCIILLTVMILFLKLVRWTFSHFKLSQIFLGFLAFLILTLLGG
jgi:ABC-type phosphate/phosphonate transport system permease subunit